MSSKNDIFEESALWPIKIGLDNIEYYTIWGNGGDTKDFIMAVGNEICLFKKEYTLLVFIRESRACNLTSLPNYESFRAWTLDRESFGSNIHYFDITEALAALKEPTWRWSEKKCDQVLDCINLFWDIANTTENPASIHLQQHGDLKYFADLLTKMSLERHVDNEALGKLVKGRLLKAFKSEYEKLKNHKIVF